MGDAIRRPAETPALGVPDMEFARARATAANNLVGNSKWLTIPTIVLTAAIQIVGTIAMKALATGRFRVRFTGVIANSGDANEPAIAAVSHGTGITAGDYIQAPTTIILGANGALALIVDLPTQGFTAAVGSTTNINALLTGVGGAVLTVPTNGMQLEVQEY
jgi:hypothetical protein